MKNRLLITCFLFISTTLFLQSSDEKNIILFKDSIQKMEFEIALGKFREFFRKDPIRVNLIISKMLNDISKSKYNDADVITAYKYICIWKFYRNKYKENIHYANLMRGASKKAGDIYNECLAINMIAGSQSELMDYGLSIETYLEALEIAKNNDLTFMKIAIEGNLAKLKMICNDFDGAIKLLENQIQEIEEKKLENEKKLFPETYSDLTEAYILKGDLKKATYYNNLGKIASKKYGYYLKINLLNQGNIEIHKNNFDEALKIFDIAEKEQSTVSNKAYYLHLYRGKAYYLKKLFRKAINEILYIETLQKKNVINHLRLQEGYTILADSYQSLNIPDSSMIYYQKAISKFEKNEKERIKLITEIAEKYDKKEFERELEKRGLTSSKESYEKYIRLENKLALLEQNKTNNYLLYGGFFSIILIIVTGRAIYNSRKNGKKINILFKELEKKTTFLDKKQQKIIKIIPSSDLKEDIVQILSKGLRKLEEKEYFLNKECTQVSVAKKLKTNTAYLSKFMNAHYGCNFNTYLNNLRIDFAINRLKNDAVFRSYTVLAISEELGYKSANTFTKSFKKHTGLLPSYYIKKMEKSIA